MAYDAEALPRTALQTETLLRLRDHILAEDIARFNMRDWSTSATPTCGTFMCIGGTLEMMVFGCVHEHKWSEAGALVGLDGEASDELFFPKRSFAQGNPFDATPAQAARVLDHLLATGKVDWSTAFTSAP